MQAAAERNACVHLKQFAITSIHCVISQAMAPLFIALSRTKTALIAEEHSGRQRLLTLEWENFPSEFHDH